jgi:glutamate dehydrogenase (NADP+)
MFSTFNHKIIQSKVEMMSTKSAVMALRSLRTKNPTASLGVTSTSTITTTHCRYQSSTSTEKKTLLTKNQDVHSNMQLSKSWRNKPLFRRQGDVRFRTGLEAANLLVEEARRRDDHEQQFIDSVESTMQCLSPIFERNPRYAFVAKQLMEPERFIQFRVPWLDDTGVIRMNRGYRVQYSSSLGPYEGALHFGSHVNSATIKSLGFDQVFSNGLSGYDLGAAVGGSDINPFDKSEAEMQRFCQSYMTELVKYIGPDVDLPTMGMGVGEKEMGYLFGQYKRINSKSSSGGRPFLSYADPTVSLFYLFNDSFQIDYIQILNSHYSLHQHATKRHQELE